MLLLKAETWQQLRDTSGSVEAALPIGGENKHCDLVPEARQTPSPMCPEPLYSLLCYAVRFLPGALVLICTELPVSNQGPSLSSPTPTSCRQPPRPPLVVPGSHWLTISVASCSLGISMWTSFPLPPRRRNSGQIPQSPLSSYQMPW